MLPMYGEQNNLFLIKLMHSLLFGTFLDMQIAEIHFLDLIKGWQLV